jgi:hypothetical protein
MTHGTARYRRRRWVTNTPSVASAAITLATSLGLACLAFSLLSLGGPSSAYAGKGGVHGSNNAGGNGRGNGAGLGGGNGAGNAYGRDDPGGPSALDTMGGNAYGKSDLDSGADSFVPPGQEGRDSAEITEALEAATKIDSGLHLGTLKDLNAISESAADFLSTIDFPGKANPPGLTGEKPAHDPKGKAVGQRREESGGDANAGGAASKSRLLDAIKIAPNSYSPNEVLAINLTPAGATQTHSLGFSTASSSRLADGTEIIVLRAPRGMDALVALRELRLAVPAERFQLNRFYRPYFPAQRPEILRQRTRPARLGVASPCEDDHCYARSAIQWKAHLAACARGVPIGVIDTSVDMHHPAFSGQGITHMRFIPEGKQASSSWHGTGVLAILAGRPDSGTPGLVPKAAFFVASTFFAGDGGEPQTDTVSLIRALDWMDAAGPKLINMSFCGPRDEILRSRIAALSARGFVFVAAAGNGGPTGEPVYPAAYPEVISVTAVNRDLQVFQFATRGSYIDLAAPGVRIWTAIPEGREGYRSGTSFAAPFVTAVLATEPQQVLSMPKDGLLDHLKIIHLGDGSGRNSTFGRGLLQAPRICLPVKQDFAGERTPTRGRRQY